MAERTNLSVDLAEDVYFNRLREIFRVTLLAGSKELGEDGDFDQKAVVAADLFINTVMHAHGMLIPKYQRKFREFFIKVLDHDFDEAQAANIHPTVARAFVLRALLDFYFRDEVSARGFVELTVNEPEYYTGSDYLETMRNEKEVGLLEKLNIVKIDEQALGFQIETFDELVMLQRQIHTFNRKFGSYEQVAAWMEQEYGYLVDEYDDIPRRAFKLSKVMQTEVENALRHAHEYFSKKLNRRFTDKDFGKESSSD